jgi:hypothetical protein
VVLNFDLNRAFDIRLKIPPDAIELSGLNKIKEWKAEEITGTKQSMIWHPGDVQNEGTAIHLPHNSGLVFEIH